MRVAGVLHPGEGAPGSRVIDVDEICGLERRCGTGVLSFFRDRRRFLSDKQVVQYSVGLLFRLPRRLAFLASLRESRGGGGLVLITGKGPEGARTFPLRWRRYQKNLPK